MRSTEPTFTETARRIQLVECAIDTIAELGYPQASVRKIGERAGVAMSVVMYHFGHKDDLVAAVVSECYRTLLAAMEPAVGAETTAAGKLSAHIRAHLAYMRSHRAHQIAITEVALGFRGRNGERLADLAVEPIHLAGLSRVDLEVIVAQGVAAGEFLETGSASLATAIRGSIGAALLRSTADPDFDLNQYGEDLVELYRRIASADHH